MAPNSVWIKRSSIDLSQTIYTAYVKRVAEDDSEQAKKKMKVDSAATSSKPVTSWIQPTMHTMTERRVKWADDRMHFRFRPKADGLFRCYFGFGRQSYLAFGMNFGFVLN